MSLQYVVDAYNLIKHPQFIPIHKRSESPQKALLDFIRIKRLCGSLRNSVIVIFDGYPDVSQLKQSEDKIEVIFSRKETADEKIKKIVETSGNPKNIVVVSDDKQIGLSTKIAGSRCISIEEFIDPARGRIKTKQNLAGSQAEDYKPGLTHSQIQKINQELKKIWLK